jgi:hypothetical protein
VDAVSGSNATACCGIGTNGACQTINKAMELIDAAQAKNVTINATVDGGGGDWSAPEGPFIMLGWGVELSAPGVYFTDNAGGGEIFDISNTWDDTVGYASIVGTVTSPVNIGFDSTGAQPNDAYAIVVDPNNTLFIANASVNGSASNTYNTAAFLVNAGATLTLGQDQAGVNTGTVNIGNSLGAHATNGSEGILCQTDGVSLGCTINDAPLVGQSSVVIQGQESIGIDAYDFANITLSSNPVFGIAPSDAGFLQCAHKPDTVAIRAQGQATITLMNATIQCIAGDGFKLQSSANGNPSVTIDKATIQNTDLGIWASAGKATVTNSTIQYNFNGVQQDTDGTNNGAIDLSGGGNTVVCSSNKESSAGSANEGIDVSNTSTANLNASNVAWDTTGPDYFECTGNTSTATCTCLAASCSDAGPFDDMDAVDFNDAGINTTGATQAATHCG